MHIIYQCVYKKKKKCYLCDSAKNVRIWLYTRNKCYYIYIIYIIHSQMVTRCRGLFLWIKNEKRKMLLSQCSQYTNCVCQNTAATIELMTWYYIITVFAVADIFSGRRLGLYSHFIFLWVAIYIIYIYMLTMIFCCAHLVKCKILLVV